MLARRRRYHQCKRHTDGRVVECLRDSSSDALVAELDPAVDELVLAATTELLALGLGSGTYIHERQLDVSAHSTP